VKLAFLIYDSGEIVLKKIIPFMSLLSLSLALALAHPHVQKTVSTEIEGTSITIEYYTTPANMSHVESVAVGDFVSSRATLTLNKNLGKLNAGKYLVGSIRKGESDWAMVLYSGQLGRGESPDQSKLINLRSAFSTEHGTATHVSLDLDPGSGPLETSLAVVWHFGNLHLQGALSGGSQ
jgi:hypothetical protein